MKVFLVYDKSMEDVLREEQSKLMLTFADASKIPRGFPEIMIDSGGFQLQTGVRTTRVISPEHYALWLQLTLPQHPEITNYMNLDIMGNTEASLRNLVYLESQGLHPIPVWHAGEPDHLLDQYCENHEYVALGGLVGQGKMPSPQIRRLFEWMRHRHPHIRWHILGLGISAFVVARSFRPYSVDYSTWLNCFRYGTHFIIEDGRLKEKQAPKEIRDRIRADRAFKKEFVRQNLRTIMSCSQLLEEMNDPYQVPLL